jgi:hypothetical protein
MAPRVRIEAPLVRQTNTAYPACIGGGGVCSPEDCDERAGFMARRDGALSWDALEDQGTMVEIIDEIALQRWAEILDDDETRWRRCRSARRTCAAA